MQALTQAQRSNLSLPWAQCASSLFVFTWLAIASLMNTKLQNKITGALCCLSEQELDHYDLEKKTKKARRVSFNDRKGQCSYTAITV